MTMRWMGLLGTAGALLSLAAGCPDETITQFDTPPSAAIQAPEDLAVIESAQTAIQFTGLVSDQQDTGDELTVVWTSDVVGEDAPLYEGHADNNGGTEIITTLPAGTHVVTLEVTDTGGNSANDYITLEVAGDPIPPVTVYIDAPQPSGQYYSGDPVHFQGRVEGPNGEMELPVEWFSNVDGALFVNSSDAAGVTTFDAYLTAGLHNVSLRSGLSLDPPQAVGSATVSIQVTEHPPGQMDQDNDGYCPDGIDDDGDGLCIGKEITGPGSQDCNDFDATVCPGCPEVCDGQDNDCDGNIDVNELDQDGDGQSPCAGDCDDTDPTNFTGNTEICDGHDNNCDGLADDDDPYCTGIPTWYEDADGDAHGDVNDPGVVACLQPSGMVQDHTDCDDGNASINPSILEDCSDGLDNDCSGDTDCCDTACAAQPACVEVCDGVDNDCDGLIDEGFDQDGDGWMTCDGDCDDTDPTVYPGALDVCDFVDNDCDGYINEDMAGPYEMWETNVNDTGYHLSSINPQLTLGGGQCSFTVQIIIPITLNLVKGQASVQGIFSSPDDLYDIFYFDTDLTSNVAEWTAFLMGGGFLPSTCTQGTISFSSPGPFPIQVTAYVGNTPYSGSGNQGNLTFQLALWDLFDIDYRVIVEPMFVWQDCNSTYNLSFTIP